MLQKSINNYSYIAENQIGVDYTANFDITLNETLQIAAGLAVGIICISVIVHEANRHKAMKLVEID